MRTSLSIPLKINMNPTYHLSETELQSETVFIEAAKADPERFEVLYNKYFEPVYRFVYQRMDDKDTAFDVCEQVFLKAMTNIHRFSFRGLPFSSWLFRIAGNEISDYYRKQKSQRVINTTTEQLNTIIDEIDSDEKETDIQNVLDSLQRMDNHEIQIIELRFFEKRHFKEIGEIMNITENNAKVRLYRTLDKLKNILLNK